MKKYKIRLVLSYDGSFFKGWQKQKLEQKTVQNSLEQALSKICGQTIQVMGASRTDAGVHALAQTAHFFSSKILSSDSFIKSINALTPSTLSCHALWQAPLEFHAQKSALNRSYSYLIFNTKTPSALRRNQGLWKPHPPLNIDTLNKMADTLIGRHDFKSFQNSGTPVKDTVRVIEKAHWRRLRPGLFVFQIQGNSFLKQMVRNIVGTQLKLFREKNSAQKLKLILKAKDRKSAGPTSPAHGLFLTKVTYPAILNKKCKIIPPRAY